MFKKISYNKGRSLIGLLLLTSTGISYAQCGQNINDGIQKIIDEGIKIYHIPGMEVSISCPGEDTPRDFVSGTTKIKGEEPIRPEHLFQIGSETKSFISALILQLEAEGRLSIQDPIGKYLHTIPDTWQEVSIQQLLNHTSGLFNYTEVVELWVTLMISDFKRQFTSAQLINFVKNKEPNFFPGAGWHYSNTNYVLAGMIVESITGKTIEEELNTRILQPLKLVHTHYESRAYSENTLKQMAHGYSSLGLFLDEPKDITSQNMSWANTAGALISTSHDTAHWLRHLLTDNNFLPELQRQELMTLVDVEKGRALPAESKSMGYGLGVARFALTTGEIWGHNGGTLGFISHMYWLKCNDVVLTSVVNHIDKSETDGLGSTAITQDLIQFIQQSDPSPLCSKNLISNKAGSIYLLEKWIPKQVQGLY